MDRTAAWIDSVNAIAEVCEVDWKTAKKWTNRDDFPPKRKSGWKRIEVLEYAADAKERSADAQTGDNCDLKAEKLRLECQKLRYTVKVEKERAEQAKLETMTRKGDVKSKDVVLDALAILCSAVNGAHENLKQRIDAEFRDAKISEMADEMLATTRDLIRASIDDA